MSALYRGGTPPHFVGAPRLAPPKFISTSVGHPMNVLK